MYTWIRHNQGLVVGIILALGLVIWSIGCESTVESPISDRMVTRSELGLEVDVEVKRLTAEIDTLQREAELCLVELEKQDELKRKLYDFAALSVANNAVNPTGLITLVGSLLGLGAVVDNRIKDKVIKNRPLNQGTDTKVT